jgi:flagellar biosynthesis/type III secretory pathway ATPase
MGAYSRGSDPALDAAITAQAAVTAYITQAEDAPVDLAASVAELTAQFGEH